MLLVLQTQTPHLPFPSRMGLIGDGLHGVEQHELAIGWPNHDIGEWPRKLKSSTPHAPKHFPPFTSQHQKTKQSVVRVKVAVQRESWEKTRGSQGQGAGLDSVNRIGQTGTWKQSSHQDQSYRHCSSTSEPRPSRKHPRTKESKLSTTLPKASSHFNRTVTTPQQSHFLNPTESSPVAIHLL
jgi:hypothetical protein